MEEIYNDMDVNEREEMRLHILKATKTQKIKIERSSTKKERDKNETNKEKDREKRIKEYKQHKKEIEEDRAGRNIKKNESSFDRRAFGCK